jgi:hypothetical protein
MLMAVMAILLLRADRASHRKRRNPGGVLLDAVHLQLYGQEAVVNFSV